MSALAALGIPLGFAFPWVLIAFVFLPVIWWLLRLTPPRPASEPFPPTRILAELTNREETPARSPWWLTLLRLTMAALVIIAMASPIWNPAKVSLSGQGPLLLVMDNGWASGPDWEQHVASANQVIDEVEATGRQMIMLATVQDARQKVEIGAPDAIRAKLASWVNHPSQPDYALIAKKIAEANQKFSPDSVVFLSDGIEHPGAGELASKMQEIASQKILYLPDAKNTIVINSIENQPDSMVGELIRANTKGPAIHKVTALDIKGISVTHKLVNFPDGKNSVKFSFDIPVELRNDIVRLIIEGVENAGAVQLLDESNRRRLVGLISGEKHDNSQPLLSPLHYIIRALEPFSDLRRASDANVVKSVPELITSGVSTIIMADIGLLEPETSQKLSKWVAAGGMLIRFAGPRLAAAPNDSLLPVRIRRGDRNIGGALSWEQPKPVADFEITSPFFGLEAPRDVYVSRQVLALQEAELAQKTWARLTDGTPLVTANKVGQGWTVLFHVSSDAGWSNLPISGTFVEMLRRVINQSRSSIALTSADNSQNLPPLRLVNGKGQLTAPGVEAKPIIFANGNVPTVSLENPPGFYGTADGFRALNIFNGDAKLDLLEDSFLGENTQLAHYAQQQPLSLKPWLLFALAALLGFDCLAVLWMAGQLGFINSAVLTRDVTKTAAVLALAILIGGAAFSPAPVMAQDKNTQNDALSDDIDFSPTLRTRLAYVITGIGEVDETSEAGLRGLTRYLTQRTAIEPGEPIGVDISSDELAFYPMIYWPIHNASELPASQAMARIDAYMKQGGSVLFDTRDQNSGFSVGAGTSPEALRLQEILGNLDIPLLEPVPDDHVLTKSFFILSEFPGRYAGGDLWVEKLASRKISDDRPVRVGDGVSSILITGNDLAGAWAIDSQARPMFPIVPPNPVQREFAFRVGVNLIMYAMTGNYKSDQVHIPALLERLGQ